MVSLSIQTYNVEDSVFDSDELTTSKISGFIDGLQFDNPLEEPGVNIDDENDWYSQVYTGGVFSPMSEDGSDYQQMDSFQVVMTAQ